MFIPLTIGCTIAIAVSTLIGGRFTQPVNLIACAIIALDYYVI